MAQMGFLDFLRNPAFADSLQALSQGLIAAGSGDQNAWGRVPAYLGQLQQQRAQDQRYARAEARDQHLFDLKIKEQERQAEKERQQKALVESMLAPGTAAAMTGGANPAQRGINAGKQPSMPVTGRGDWADIVTPEQAAALRAMDPQSAIALMSEKAFETKKPVDIDIQQWEDGDQIVNGYYDVDGNQHVISRAPRWQKPQPKEPRAPNWISLIGPNGEEVTVDANAGETAQMIANGYKKPRSSMFGAPPVGYMENPKAPGALVPIPGGPADPANPKNISDTDKLSAGFADRLAAADKIIGDNTVAGTSYIDAGLAGVPLLGNTLSSESRQQYDQAKRDFITAQLRKESGASISEGEFATAEKLYFPQPGDDKKTIENKAAARKTAIANMRRNAGAAATPVQDNDPLGILD